MNEPPWAHSGNWDEERECTRCGETIPAKWRHFWRPCSCTYLPANQPPHDPDPECGACEGTGYLPCEPQDLRILRMWGACQTCGAYASILIDEHGATMVDSGRHREGTANHVVLIAAVPLAETLDNYLTIAAGSDTR